MLAIGPVPSPFDCYLANRGLKTLHLRMRQHEINATAVAKFLEGNPRVEKVMYPGMLGRGELRWYFSMKRSAAMK